METEQIQISLTPALYRQFTRLKVQGRFASDADLLQTCFETLERHWERGVQSNEATGPMNEPYMSRPALGIEDYDT